MLNNENKNIIKVRKKNYSLLDYEKLGKMPLLGMKLCQLIIRPMSSYVFQFTTKHNMCHTIGINNNHNGFMW